MHPPGLPLTLSRLRSASEDSGRDDAWAAFVAEHSDVVLHVCRSLSRDRDGAMDGYVFVLEALREDGCRRLQAYVPDGKTRFTTWLVVVCRRLVLDYYRRRYGRSRSDDDTRRTEQATRRKLEDLVADEIDPDQLESAAASRPDVSIRRKQLTEALRQALDELDAQDRLLLALRFSDARSVREIRKTLGLPSVFHVYRRLGGALATLRRALAVRGVEEPEP